MSTQNERSAITALIKAYGEALSSANAKAVGAFYAIDGAIFPNGHNTIEKKQLDHIAGEFFKKSNFRIQFQTGTISISGDYAIVESVATVNSTSTKGEQVNKTTRDLFVLCKSEGAWKIYRYIFNNSK